MSSPLSALSRTLLAGVLTLSAAAADAGTVHVVFDSPIFNGVPAPTYDVVTITYPTPGGSRLASVAAGRFQGTASNLVGVSESLFVDGLNDLFMYCYDVYERVGSGWSVDYAVNLDGESARTLDFLGAVNAVLNLNKPTADLFAWLHPTSGAMAAAIQLGLWESKYDSGGWDLAGGSFRATGVDASTASHLSAYLGALAGSPSLDGRYVMTLEASGVQDMITGDPPADVPEPGTLALLAVAALALRRPRRHGR
jgi:MYXO-CTERM domain-containing protein